MYAMTTKRSPVSAASRGRCFEDGSAETSVGVLKMLLVALLAANGEIRLPALRLEGSARDQTNEQAQGRQHEDVGERENDHRIHASEHAADEEPAASEHESSGRMHDRVKHR